MVFGDGNERNNKREEEEQRTGQWTEGTERRKREQLPLSSRVHPQSRWTSLPSSQSSSLALSLSFTQAATVVQAAPAAPVLCVRICCVSLIVCCDANCRDPREAAASSVSSLFLPRFPGRSFSLLHSCRTICMHTGGRVDEGRRQVSKRGRGKEGERQSDRRCLAV